MFNLPPEYSVFSKQLKYFLILLVNGSSVRGGTPGLRTQWSGFKSYTHCWTLGEFPNLSVPHSVPGRFLWIVNGP